MAENMQGKNIGKEQLNVSEQVQLENNSFGNNLSVGEDVSGLSQSACRCNGCNCRWTVWL